MYTTSASELRSNDRFIIHKLKELEKENDRFIIKTDMDKKSYYENRFSAFSCQPAIGPIGLYVQKHFSRGRAIREHGEGGF